MILCSNPAAQYFSHKTEIDQAINRVLEKGYYILGQEVNAFEQEFADYCNVDHCFGVGNGTDALHVALIACGVGPGDEVITVSHTAVATVSAIELAGAVPVFADIEADYYTLDPTKLKSLLSAKTKAIIAVHLYGQPVDLNPILAFAKEHNLRVIEDCAQAHGSEYQGKRSGSIGDLSCFSFYPTKNLGAIGDGGAVVTKDPQLAERIKLLREYGWKDRYVSSIPGWNTRLDELQAAILRIKLRTLDADNKKRRQIAEYYNKNLAGLPLVLPTIRSESSHVFHLYVIRSQKRDQLQTFLKEQNIHTLIHYPMPIHLQPAYIDRIKTSSLSETVKAASEILSLPIYPELTQEEAEIVISAIKRFYQS